MTWRKPADRSFVHAVIETFRDDSERAFEQLSSLAPRVWEQSDYWLDASGLALYFYDLLCKRSASDLVPAGLLEQLRSNTRKNRRRTEALFRELVALNQSFSKAGIVYANHKGFTLCPHACPLPELRHQLDLDFLVIPEHLGAARNCLEERGYRRSAATQTTWEFKGGNDVRRKRSDNYTMGTYRSVELHFASYGYEHRAARDPRLLRLSSWTWRAKVLPALSPVDQLIGQALHLFSHFRNESTRPSWLLEFRNHVVARCDDSPFWRELIKVASTDRHAPIALGLSILISSNVFGRFAPPAFEAWALGSLPPPIRLWAETYGVEAMLADFPGTKLYLLLESQLEALEGRPATAIRTRLFPVRWMEQRFIPVRTETTTERLRRYALIGKFALFRLRFHAVEAFRISLALPRWHRLLRARSLVSSPIDIAVREMTNRKQLHDNFRAASR